MLLEQTVNVSGFAGQYGARSRAVNTAELRAKVFSRPWFHKIDLGNGIVTPGVDDSPAKLKHIHLPENLSGKTLIDIGAFDGFFSFEAERRGARRILATDHFAWRGTGMIDGAGFLIAHEALESRVEVRVIPVEELSPWTVGMFDLVLFLGVLYHSPDPLGYLRAARSVCREMLILETHYDALDYPRPAMVFYPGATLNNDPSNFWGPNPLCVAEMLKEAGFRNLKVFPRYAPTRGVVHAFV
jgi:tRNA (mo5U34)-methyltransferase